MLGRDLSGERDHVGDMVGRDRPAARRADVEIGEVLFERQRIVRRDIPDAFGRGAGAASILSSPASASDVRWPTSVMLMTWVSGPHPMSPAFHVSTRLSVSVRT